MKERRLLVKVDSAQVYVVLSDGPTASLVWYLLPIKSVVNTWGDEIYFPIPISVDQEDTATEVVQVGAVAFWPPGKSLCLFFGPTPASISDEVRAASPVNLVGMIEGDPSILRDVVAGVSVDVERIS